MEQRNEITSGGQSGAHGARHAAGRSSATAMSFSSVSVILNALRLNRMQL